MAASRARVKFQSGLVLPEASLSEQPNRSRRTASAKIEEVGRVPGVDAACSVPIVGGKDGR